MFGSDHRILKRQQMGLLALVILVMAGGCGKAERPYNVVIFTFDTVRADAIGCYGNERVGTPAIDALAAEGVRFAQADTPLPITLPSHATILTGRYPMAHGVRDNGLFVVPHEETTLAEILAARGYRTGASVGAFPVISRFGLNQGFEFFDDDVSPSTEDDLGRLRKAAAKIYFDARRAGRVNEALIPWLDQHADEPFFLWLHYYDPHHPLAPPPPFNQLFADDPYLGEISYADSCFGQFLEHLKELGVDDRTIIVMTSDHGEGRGDHNEDTHSLLNYQSTLHVPLIIRVPGGPAGVVISSRVGTVDIVPTILDYLGISDIEGIQGQSLRPVMEGRFSSGAPSLYYAETLSPRLSHDWGELRTLYEGKFKYIHGPRPELFDLEADPGEVHDLSGEMPDRVDEMKSSLQEFMTRHVADHAETRVTMDEDTRARLEALGYVDIGGDTSEILEVLREGGIAPQDRVQDVNLWTRTKDALAQEKPSDAKEAVSSLLRRNPENPVYRDALVTALLKLGEIDEALRQLDLIPQVDLGGTIHPKSQTLMMAASALASTGRITEALDMAEECERLHPSAMVLYLKRALLLQIGRTDDADEALLRSLELDPAYVPSRAVLAAKLGQAGDEGKAREILEAIIGERPFFAPAHYNLGVVALGGSGLEAALVHFRRAVELDPFYIKARYAVIAILLDLEEGEEAQKAMKVLEYFAPESPETLQAQQLMEDYS